LGVQGANQQEGDSWLVENQEVAWWGGAKHARNYRAVSLPFVASCVSVKERLRTFASRLVISRTPTISQERIGFFTLLKDELIKYHQEQFIIDGDINCTLDFTGDRTSEEPHPQSSQSLKCTITHLDPLDTWRVKHPYSRQYTWVRVSNNRVNAARQDRIYSAPSLSSRLKHSS